MTPEKNGNADNDGLKEKRRLYVRKSKTNNPSGLKVKDPLLIKNARLELYNINNTGV